MRLRLRSWSSSGCGAPGVQVKPGCLAESGYASRKLSRSPAAASTRVTARSSGCASPELSRSRAAASRCDEELKSPVRNTGVPSAAMRPSASRGRVSARRTASSSAPLDKWTFATATTRPGRTMTQACSAARSSAVVEYGEGPDSVRSPEPESKIVQRDRRRRRGSTKGMPAASAIRARLRSASCTPTMSALAARSASPTFSRLTCSPPYQTLNVMIRSVTASSAAAAGSDMPAGHSRSASKARFMGCRLLGLAEAQREAIAFADREVLGAVHVAALQGRRQGPDAVGVIRRVLRVGVDVALADQLEAGFLDQRDRVVLAHVARLRLGVLRLVGFRAMLGNAEDAARLQGRIHRLEHGIGRIVAHPAVNVAEREDHVHRPIRDRLQGIRGLQGRDLRAVVELRARCELVRELLRVLLRVLARVVRVPGRRDVAAALAQRGREDLGVPAAAARRDFHDRHVLAEAEELQSLLRMAELVAGLVLRRAVVTGQHLVEGRERFSIRDGRFGGCSREGGEAG